MAGAARRARARVRAHPEQDSKGHVPPPTAQGRPAGRPPPSKTAGRAGRSDCNFPARGRPWGAACPGPHPGTKVGCRQPSPLASPCGEHWLTARLWNVGHPSPQGREPCHPPTSHPRCRPTKGSARLLALNRPPLRPLGLPLRLCWERQAVCQPLARPGDCACWAQTHAHKGGARLRDGLADPQSEPPQPGWGSRSAPPAQPHRGTWLPAHACPQHWGCPQHWPPGDPGAEAQAHREGVWPTSWDCGGCSRSGLALHSLALPPKLPHLLSPTAHRQHPEDPRGWEAAHRGVEAWKGRWRAEGWLGQRATLTRPQDCHRDLLGDRPRPGATAGRRLDPDTRRCGVGPGGVAAEWTGRVRPEPQQASGRQGRHQRGPGRISQ